MATFNRGQIVKVNNDGTWFYARIQRQIEGTESELYRVWETESTERFDENDAGWFASYDVSDIEPIAAPAAVEPQDAASARIEQGDIVETITGERAKVWAINGDEINIEYGNGEMGVAPRGLLKRIMSNIDAEIKRQQNAASEPTPVVNEPIAAAPAPKFQLGQAVRGAFWSKSAGRVVSISRNDGYFYEVQLPSGRIVLEPEAYLTAAPELETKLPQMTTRRPLTTREIEISMDTPDYDAGNSSDHCQWNGIDQLNPDAR